MRRNACLLTVLAATFSVTPAFADPADFSLFQWIFNVDGTIYDSAGIDGSSTLPANFSVVSGTPLDLGVGGGLGVLSVVFDTPGLHNFIAFFDQEIRETLNGFSNESAFAVGVPSAGLSFEAGEPGFFTPPPNIYTRTLAGALGNVIGPVPDDMALALGWSFLLGAGDTATILLSLSETAPVGGFYLHQIDPDPAGARNLYYSTSLTINAIPEPGYYGVFVVVVCCFIAAIVYRRRLGSVQPTR